VLELRQQLIGYVVSYPRPGSDDQPVGDVQSTGVSGKTYVMHGGTCFIENIAVFPQYQGSGYGKLLVDRVIAMARQCCCCSVELYTNALMVENIEWYNKLGFEEFERKYEEGFSRVYLRRALSG